MSLPIAVLFCHPPLDYMLQRAKQPAGQSADWLLGCLHVAASAASMETAYNAKLSSQFTIYFNDYTK